MILESIFTIILWIGIILFVIQMISNYNPKLKGWVKSHQTINKLINQGSICLILIGWVFLYIGANGFLFKTFNVLSQAKPITYMVTFYFFITMIYTIITPYQTWLQRIWPQVTNPISRIILHVSSIIGFMLMILGLAYNFTLMLQ